MARLTDCWPDDLFWVAVKLGLPEAVHDLAESERENQMDANELLERARVAARNAQTFADADDSELGLRSVATALGCYQALDDWLTRGGRLPTEWQASL